MASAQFDDPLAALQFPYYTEEIHALMDQYGLSKFADHWHETVLSFLFYQGVYLASGIITPYFVRPYKDLTLRNRINFDIHVSSMVNCFVLLYFSWPLFFDPILSADHVYGYTPYAGFLCATAAGYFIWDTMICFTHISLFGPEFLVHGAVAAFVFIQSFRPYILHYSPIFLVFEASTPFVNLHWFSSHLPEDYVPDILKIVNGLVLIVVFFFARIVWGYYQAYNFFIDVFINDKARIVPIWVPICVFTCNITLNCLNVVWFNKMLKAARSKLNGGSKVKKANKVH